jgi:hypothetical protein
VPKLSGPLIEPAIATDGPLGKMVLTVLGTWSLRWNSGLSVNAGVPASMP